MRRRESPEPGSLPRQQAVLIKTEPECDAPTFDIEVAVEVERIKSKAEQLLYADHEVKEEMVIGPTEIQRPKQTPGEEFVVLCVREGECSAELRTRLTPQHLPHNQPQTKLTPFQCQSSTTPHQRNSADKKSQNVCDVCNKIFKWKSDLLKHIPVHSREKTFSCDVCNKVFKLNCDLLKHLRESGEKPFSCDVCNKKFNQAGNLFTHKRIHSEDRPYACDLCDKKYKQSCALTAHKRLHSGDRPFACDLCDKKFIQSGALTAHKRLHSGERPYSCDVCKKAFNLPGNLTAHKRLHSGERPYSCDVCKKAFTLPGNLAAHKRLHSGERPYSCDVCKKAFNLPGNLTRHMLTHDGKGQKMPEKKKPLSCDINVKRDLPIKVK